MLVPRAEHGLVRQVHLRINGATIITAERDGLLVRAVYSRVRIVLTDIIRLISIGHLGINLSLLIDVRAHLCELRLDITVDHIFKVSTVVHIEVLVNLDAVVSRDPLPIVFVVVGQLRIILCLRDDHSLHGGRCETARD